jgi:hypothetical protein
MKRKFWLKQEEETGGEGSAGGSDTSFVSEAPAAPEPANDSTESDVNWVGLAEELTKDDTVEGEDIVEESAPEAAPAPTPAPATPAVPAETPAVTPATPEPAKPAQAPVQAAPEQPAASPEQYQTWRATRVSELEKTYSINEDDAAALLTEPEVVLPRLMANAHMVVLENAMQAVQAMMPVMMQQIQSHTEMNTRAKSLFTSVNPDLADPQYESAIMQLGQVYRNVNRTAPPEEAARAIGALVRSALGIAQAPAPAAAQAAPQVAAPIPFTPARGSGGGMLQRGSDNLYTQLADEFLSEDN